MSLIPPWTISVSAPDGFVEPHRDLVGALAPDAEVAQLELGMEQRRPVLPLTLGVPGPGARIPERRALGDRVTEAGDDGHRGSVTGVVSLPERKRRARRFRPPGANVGS